jgi:hypothetical protein
MDDFPCKRFQNDAGQLKVIATFLATTHIEPVPVVSTSLLSSPKVTRWHMHGNMKKKAFRVSLSDDMNRIRV